MGLLGCEVLAEPHAARLQPDAQQKQLRASEEVGQRFVVDDAVRHGLAGGCAHRAAVAHLVFSGEQHQLHVFDGVEALVGLVQGVHKMFDFRHHELTDAVGRGHSLRPV